MLNIQQVLDRQLPETDGDASTRAFFVAPNPTELPDDGVLNYVVISSVYDLKDAPERSVLLFPASQERLLSILASNPDVFGLRLQCLAGVPKADYSVSFDQTVWNMEKVSYGPLLSELRLSIEVDAQTRAAGMTLHDQERARVTRSSGEVKAHTAFDLAVDDGDAPDA